MFEDENLDKEYVDEQIAQYGQIESFTNCVSYCPYCGHANKIDKVDLYFDEENDAQCGKCEKYYIEILEQVSYIYSTTKRIKENDYE